MSSYERDDFDEPAAIRARDRVTLPAIFLIIVGFFNLFGSGYLIINGLVVMYANEATLRQSIEVNPMLKSQNVTVDQIRSYGWFYIAAGAVALLLNLVTIIGGFTMRSLTAYPLAIIAAVTACIPVLSCLACCGIGEGIGIWALVVLLNPEVQAAFGGRPPD